MADAVTTTKAGMEIIADTAFVGAVYIAGVVLAAWWIPAPFQILGGATPWVVGIAPAVYAGKWARKHKWFK